MVDCSSSYTVEGFRSLDMTWVHEKIFAAGGSHIPETWRAFADQTGIRAVLHLSSDRPALFRGPSPRAFLWLDIEDEIHAGLPQRQLAGRFIMMNLEHGELVLLHSSSGRHRTRWAFVAYSILSGASVNTALRRAAEQPWLSPYHTDRKTWEAFAESVHPGCSRLSHGSSALTSS